jgi:hypothetical protein
MAWHCLPILPLLVKMPSWKSRYNPTVRIHLSSHLGQSAVMFRVAFIALMLLQSLAGPNPCCCTLGRVAAITMSWMRLSEGQRIQSSCCGEPLNVGESEGEQSEPQSCCGLSGSKGPTKHCKCHKSLCNAVPSPNSNFSTDVGRSWLDGLVLVLAAPLLLATGEFVAIVAYPDGIPPATRSGREIRVALHSWQC